MSWAQKLYETYEKNIEIDTNKGTESMRLTPMSHIMVKAQVEVQLDKNGKFIKADIINKDDAWTLIPVTDASGIRSSGIAPHPLCDNLSYIAGDFVKFGGIVKRDKTTNKTGYDYYIEQLKGWADCSNPHPKVISIYSYLSKRTLAFDLIQSEILKLDENGLFLHQKINDQPYEKVLVRFHIQDGSDAPRVWEDRSLVENYINYVNSKSSYETRLDLIKGEFLPSNELHPKGILPSEYGAKLISSNDKYNFTYRGRFETPVQAANLSYEVSQKVHAALTWLLRNQGVAIGNSGRYYVYWSPNPQMTLSTFGAMLIKGPTVQQQNQDNLLHWLISKKKSLEYNNEVIVMGLEAPTPGQLAIIEYHEYNAKQFFENLIYWQKTCSWWFWGKDGLSILSPSLYRIANNTYGVERSEKLEVNDKLFRDVITRLQSCMINHQSLPYDIVKRITQQASCLQKYNKSNRNSILSTACALIRKYKIDHNQGEAMMTLDNTNNDRNYLFGRLLAVYERIEIVASVGKNTDRTTNAMRLQTAFAQHPGNVWKILERQVSPYLNKLSGGARENFRKLITEIVTRFDGNINSNTALNENYLLGYYLQRADFYNKKNETMTDEIEKGVE